MIYNYTHIKDRAREKEREIRSRMVVNFAAHTLLQLQLVEEYVNNKGRLVANINRSVKLQLAKYASKKRIRIVYCYYAHRHVVLDYFVSVSTVLLTQILLDSFHETCQLCNYAFSLALDSNES